MSDNITIRDSIQQIVSSQNSQQNVIIYGIVEEIIDENTIAVRNIKGDGNELISNVKINLDDTINNQFIPTIDSEVLVVLNTIDNGYYLIKTDEVQSGNIEVTDSLNVNVTSNNGIVGITADTITLSGNTFNIGNSGSTIATITFNDGSNEGLAKVIELTNKLNALEERINALQTSFTNWTPVAQDGGLALKTLWIANCSGFLPIVETTKEEIQNNKITH